MSVQLPSRFDSTTVEPSTPFEPVPTGWYPVRIIESETKPTKDNAGAYIQLTLEIFAGEHQGKKGFDRLNVHNQNPQAVEIAWRTLSAICRATGVLQIENTAQLHGVPMEAKFVLRQAEKGPDGKDYGASNDIKGYRSIEAQPTAAPAGFPVTAPQPATPAAQTGWSQPTVPAAAPAGGWSPPAAAPPAPAVVQAPSGVPSWAQGPATAPAAPAAPQAAPATPAAPPAAAPSMMPWQKK